MFIPDQTPKQAMGRLHDMVSNSNFVIKDDDNIDYKDGNVGSIDEINTAMAMEDILRRD